MNNNTVNKYIKISSFVPIVYLIFALTDGFFCFFALLLCAFLHEGGHLVAMHFCKIPIEKLTILPFGISITVKDGYLINYTDELKCALSGPLVNLITGLIFIVIQNYFKVDCRFLIICNLFLFLLNILPIMPLDGGRALNSLLLLKLNLETAIKISDFISVVLLIPVMGLGIYILHSTGYNFSLLLIGIYLSVNFMLKNIKLKSKSLA